MHLEPDFQCEPNGEKTRPFISLLLATGRIYFQSCQSATLNSKWKSYTFKNGQQPPHSLPIETSPHSKKLKVESPKTALFSEMRFPSPVGSYRIKTGSGLESTSLDVTIPTGNSICNLEILSLVFAQLNCIDRECYGRLKLYERHIQDGLQCFLLLKYTRCHGIVAEFPTTLPIGVAALDSINNKSVRGKG